MPTALDGLIEQVRAAMAAKTPLRTRGGGSKDFYWPGGALHGEAQGKAGGDAQAGQVLDTTPLNGIVSYEPSELVVTVQAGTPLAELEAVLAEKNQCLPFEPPHFGGGATVGGMVAAGLAGPARASVGGVRDYVLGLELLNGRAELLRFGGTVMKNVAGYDVSRLMVGAMGTLGLITEVSLKVLPIAPAEATLVFDMDQATALRQLNLWGGQPLPLNASRWQGADLNQTTGQSADQGTLHLRLRGAKAAVEAAVQQMVNERGGRPIDAATAAAGWQQCRDLTLPFFTQRASGDQVLVRTSLAQSAPVLTLPGAQLVEWHGGLRWRWVSSDIIDLFNKHDNNINKINSIIIANNVNYLRLNSQIYSLKILNNINLNIQRRLKAEFDPAGIFNPGRLHAEF